MLRDTRPLRRLAVAGTAWGCLLLGALAGQRILAAQARARIGPGKSKGPFSQFASRAEWQMPARVMDEIGVRPGMTLADVGAGDGWFTFLLADRVGPSGRVIAEDIDAGALEAVRERCAKEKVSNVSVVVGEAEDAKLPAGTVDVVLMVNVLTAIHEPTGLLLSLAKGLKPDGQLVIIDWDPGKLGQLAEGQANPLLELTRRQVRDAGFEVVRILDFLPTQRMWVCRRQRLG